MSPATAPPSRPLARNSWRASWCAGALLIATIPPTFDEARSWCLALLLFLHTADSLLTTTTTRSPPLHSLIHKDKKVSEEAPIQYKQVLGVGFLPAKAKRPFFLPLHANELSSYSSSATSSLAPTSVAQPLVCIPPSPCAPSKKSTAPF